MMLLCRQVVFLVLFAGVLLLPARAGFAANTPGMDLAVAAQGFFDEGLFDKALVFADKAVGALKEESKKNTGLGPDLAQAHMLKATILFALGKGVDDPGVKEAVHQAVQAAPGMRLDEMHVANPELRAALTKELEAYPDRLEQVVYTAAGHAMAKDYCQAKDMLEPNKDFFPLLEKELRLLATNTYMVSAKECGAPAPPAPPGPSAPVPPAPEPPRKVTGKIGVVSVLIHGQNRRLLASSGCASKGLSDKNIVGILKKYIDAEFVSLPAEMLEAAFKKFDVEDDNRKRLVVRFGQVVIDGAEIVEDHRNAEKHVGLNSLPERFAKIIAYLFEKSGVDYLVVTSMDSKALPGGGDPFAPYMSDIDVRANLFFRDNAKKPLCIVSSLGVKRCVETDYFFDKLADDIADEYKEHFRMVSK